MKTLQVTEKVKMLTNTRKKLFFFSTCEKHSTNSYLDGGSRDEWLVVNIDTIRRHVPSPGTYPWTTPNDYTLQPGDILINNGIFRGKPTTPHFYCRPDEEARILTWLGFNVNA